jgi:hypothetical protein
MDRRDQFKKQTIAFFANKIFQTAQMYAKKNNLVT